MTHDVFISYAHEDQPTGDAVCAVLEGRGIRCWMAPRDVLPGVIYSAAIVEAIHASRVFVLIFSAEANVSPHVMRELERAVNDGIPVVPLRIEDVPLSPSMEYFISTPHWLDALMPPLEKHLARLADTVKLLLQKAAAADVALARVAAAPPPPEPRAPTAPPVATSAAVLELTLETPSPPRAAPSVTNPVAGMPASSAAVPAASAAAQPGARGVSLRGLPMRAVAAVAGLIVVVVAGLLITSMPGGGGTGLASATPYGPTSSSGPVATSAGSSPPSSPTASGAQAATWTVTGSMTVGRRQHTATLLATGKVLVAGGQTDQEGIQLNSAELYDPTSGTWTMTGSMRKPRATHMSVLLKNGMVLVISQHNYDLDNNTDSAELYDPATGTWSTAGSTSGRHEGGTATLLTNGEVLVAGGIDPGSRYDSEIYDPSTGRWRAGGAMGTVRRGHTATLLADGRVLVAGGAPAESITDRSIASAEVYDPRTGIWSATGSMASARGGHAAVRLPDGRVLVAGGSLHEPSTGAEAGLSSAELYDPTTEQWTSVRSLAIGRTHAAATLLADGRVLMVGGLGLRDGKVTECEIFDPRSGSWSTGPMMIGRADHTTTLLADGRRVLVAGGSGGTTLANPGAQIFDPGGDG